MNKLIQDICDVVEDKYDLHTLTDAQKQEIERLIGIYVEDIVCNAFHQVDIESSFDLITFIRLPEDYKYLWKKSFAEMTLLQIIEEMKECKELKDLEQLHEDAKDALLSIFESIKGDL